VKCNTRIKRK